MIEREIPILFHDQTEGPKDPVTLPVSDFAENKPIPFTETDAKRLLTTYDELAKQGYRGALQVVHQRGSSGEVIPSFMPQEWVEKHLQRLYILGPNHSRDGINENRDIVVVTHPDGSMSSDDQEKLAEAVKGRVGIFGGGGDGHPLDKQYIFEMKAWEQALKSGTPIVAECLTHEFVGEILREQVGSSEGVVPGTLELLTSVVDVTEEGKQHPIFSRTGNKFVTMVGNWYHLQADDPEKNQRPAGVVLGRNAATRYPVAYSIGAEYPDQVTSYQYHPYHPLGTDTPTGDIRVEPSGAEDTAKQAIIVPSHKAHPLQVELAEYLASTFKELHDQYGMTEEDLQALFHPGITAKALGVDFYGPVFQYFADKRLEKS